MASFANAAADSPSPRDDRLELHVRCVAGEEKVAVSVNLSDGSTIALNRSRDEVMSSTLRRLSLTVQKRRRLADGKAGRAGGGGGKVKGEKKRAKNDSSGVYAGLFSKETGEPIEVDGVLNRDGWTRLCGGEHNSAGGSGGGTEKAGGNDDSRADCHDPTGSNSSLRSSSGEHGQAVVRIGPASVAATDADAEITTTPLSSAAAAACATNHSSTAAGAGAEGEGVLELDVVVNPPAVTSLECAVGLPMAGFSIVAQAEAEFETGLDWEWLREDEPEEESGAAAAAAAGGGASKKGQQKNTGQPARSRGFTGVVGTLRAYTPADEDVGRRLMVKCTPLGRRGRRGRPVVRVLSTPVRPGCEPGPLSLRSRWLEGRRSMEGGDVRVSGDTGGGKTRRLRVMCYNILADMYCTSDQADKVLYPHCPKKFRAMDYRMQMVAREIRGHAADLIMLQECEVKAYGRFLAPGLEFDGLQGIYLNKAGQAQEGEAIFYRSSVLTLEARHDFSMRDAIPALEEFRGLLEAFPILSAIVKERLTTVAQIAVFRPTSPSGPSGGRGEGGATGADGGAGSKQASQEEEEEEEDGKGSTVRLIAANTHLYFHPNAAHIRLMQLVALVERISRVRQDLMARGLRPVVVLGGDLNSPPFGPVRYLMGEVIGPDSDLWSNAGTFKWGDRFFDELATAPEAAAAAAAAVGAAAASSTREDVPTPSTGAIGTASAAAVKSGGGGGVTDGAPNAAVKRPFLPGVPYLRVPLGLELVSGAPPFTNFTPEFTETLDYVFIEGGRRADIGVNAAGSSSSSGGAHAGAILSVEGGKAAAAAAAAAVAPMPEEGSLRAMTPGLPSETFPSDHVSLVVDLALVGV